MRIGILQTGRTPEELRNKHGDYDDMLTGSSAGAGSNLLPIPHPKSVRDADVWLITGSRFGVYENHSWIPRWGFCR
jgi:hypothetical protein